jgi:predicted ATPase
VSGLIGSCPSLTVLIASRAAAARQGRAANTPFHHSSCPPPPGIVRVEKVLRFALRQAAWWSAPVRYPLLSRSPRQTQAAVASICWRLAGIPLALELAAAKAKFLDPKMLLSRLDRALSTSGGRDLPDRQRTMRATLDWSHDLLSSPSGSCSGACRCSPGASRLRPRRLWARREAPEPRRARSPRDIGGAVAGRGAAA